MGMARAASWLFGLVGCAALPLAALAADDAPGAPAATAQLWANPGHEIAVDHPYAARADVFAATVAAAASGAPVVEADAAAALPAGKPSLERLAADAAAPPASMASGTQPGAAVPPSAAAIEARLADPKAGWPARLPAKERESVAAWYRQNGSRPVWTAGSGLTPAAEGLLDRLRRADEDGLDAADYALAPLAATDETALAAAEIRLSATALLYARDARGGRLAPNRISALITPKLDLPGAEALLPRLAAAADPGAALGAYNPGYPGYQALKARLAAVRADRPSGPMATLPQAPIVVSRRLASLDMPARTSRLEGDILANMERWRWLPAEVAPRYVFVNVPEFRLRLVEGGRAVHETRVITGKTDTPTPIFSGEMETAVVNPSWFIPPSIMKKEILPGLAADPGYAARRGYEVVRRGSQISVRQPPGERNALGFIKFLFPNQHAVYLHDTPNRNLFGASQRAFSHGCVRVEHPFALADFVLGHDWTEARLRKLIGRGERSIRLPEKLPVHIGYFTLTVDEFGELRSFEDVYGYNRRVRAALGLG